jgi:hypothetical protein
MSVRASGNIVSEGEKIQTPTGGMRFGRGNRFKSLKRGQKPEKRISSDTGAIVDGPLPGSFVARRYNRTDPGPPLPVSHLTGRASCEQIQPVGEEAVDGDACPVSLLFRFAAKYCPNVFSAQVGQMP